MNIDKISYLILNLIFTNPVRYDKVSIIIVYVGDKVHKMNKKIAYVHLGESEVKKVTA